MRRRCLQHLEIESSRIRFAGLSAAAPAQWLWHFEPSREGFVFEDGLLKVPH